MDTLTINLSEDEFDLRFPLVTNHLNPDAGWALGEGAGCLFETHGEEFDFVQRQDPRKVWTFMDGDDGAQVVCTGLHYVNRIGYLVSTIAVPQGIEFEVRIGPEEELPPPLVLVSVRGGLIVDVDATIPLTVAIEDWDLTDEDTGERPLRIVLPLAGELTQARAATLLHPSTDDLTSN